MKLYASDKRELPMVMLSISSIDDSENLAKNQTLCQKTNMKPAKSSIQLGTRAIVSYCFVAIIIISTSLVECTPILELNTLPLNPNPWIPIKDQNYQTKLLMATPIQSPQPQVLLLALHPQQDRQLPNSNRLSPLPIQRPEIGLINAINSYGLGSTLIEQPNVTSPISSIVPNSQVQAPPTIKSASSIKKAQVTAPSSCSEASSQVRGDCKSLLAEANSIARQHESKAHFEGEMKTSASAPHQLRARNKGGLSNQFDPNNEDSVESSNGDGSAEVGPNGGLIATPSSGYDNEDEEQLTSKDSREQPQSSGPGEYEAAPDEAAARKEQEAAEASEAEAANKSALDEQQQAQREIILQQAQSEARAIKAQQEALMMQQRLQQQMLMRRHQELVNPKEEKRSASKRGDSYNDVMGIPAKRSSNGNGSGRGGMSLQGENRLMNAGESNMFIHDNNPNEEDDGRYRPSKYRGSQLTLAGTSKSSRKSHLPQQSSANERIQFSDQLAGYSDPNGNSNYENDQEDHSNNNRVPLGSGGGYLGGETNLDPNSNYGQLSDSSVRQASISSLNTEPIAMSTKLNLTSTGDLLPAAQHHHYGAHYGYLGGHHGGHHGGHKKDYYQFAESHKKGQFISGFKRGGKKFHISGHSSQHKSHADGHVKWKGKKGKGSQYWDLKHKGKKHHHHHHHYS